MKFVLIWTARIEIIDSKNQLGGTACLFFFKFVHVENKYRLLFNLSYVVNFISHILLPYFFIFLFFLIIWYIERGEGVFKQVSVDLQGSCPFHPNLLCWQLLIIMSTFSFSFFVINTNRQDSNPKKKKNAFLFFYGWVAV